MPKSTDDNDAIFSEVELDDAEPAEADPAEADPNAYVPADYSALTTQRVVESACGCVTNADGESAKCTRCQLDETVTMRMDILNHEVNGLCNHVAQLHRMLMDQFREINELKKNLKDLADGRLEIKPAPDSTDVPLNSRWTLSSPTSVSSVISVPSATSEK